MRNEIRAEIKRLSRKAFEKKRKAQQTERKYREKFERRTGLEAGHPPATTETFPHRHFDPAHCKRHANAIASGIWHKVLHADYQPDPALHFELPKPDGSKRGVMAFGIPDAAVANVVLRRTLHRNKKRLSPHSYAYHPDKNVFDAILALNDFDRDGKLFAVQIDFEKYFDKIPATYIKRKLSDRSVVGLTPHERHIYESFLHHRYGDAASHASGIFKRRINGTPQGSSVSLFLANLANDGLDRQLAAESGKFVRFADDVVAICGNYEEAQRLEKCFDRHCSQSGLILNRRKSPGIAVIADHQHEIRTISDFTYLGYSFKETGLAMPQKTALKLKQKVSRLINIYLIHALQFGFNSLRSNRSGRYDWDLLGLIYELRRGFYGGLKEAEITTFLYNGGRLNRMRGLMGFYCLIEDPALLKTLDGWTLSIVRRACVRRHQILQTNYGRGCPTPSNQELALGTWLSNAAWRDEDDTASADDVEVVFPSLVRGWRAARKHFFTYGLEDVQAPGYDSSMDVASLFDAIDY
ncbi:reverse transcriptase domain-containing protein [Rhizobium leguminosarum]|uniref:reverse transcriptase domain-containing protein n=1 Tax=Rhizobium leguminosarum TaxID=384 RepID=UPI0003A3E70A|nr:reverse transcriptase domain-containing protein [Rhizobium leguminosarum]